MNFSFEWDPDKAASNLRKHGVSFGVAIQAFADPFALTEQDRIEGGEYRWQTLGRVRGATLLLVGHSSRDEEDGTETIRIISAREAERPERRRYEEHARSLYD